MVIRGLRHSHKWMVRLKKSLYEAVLKPDVPLSFLRDVVEQKNDPKELLANWSIGPFWRVGDPELYIQAVLDFDAPCSSCAERGAKECSHKDPLDAALEVAAKDVKVISEMLEQHGLRASGYVSERFEKRDFTILLSGRRGLELRLEFLLLLDELQAFHSLLYKIAPNLGTLDITASTRISEPVRAPLSIHPGDGAELLGMRLPIDIESLEAASHLRRLQKRSLCYGQQGFDAICQKVDGIAEAILPDFETSHNPVRASFIDNLLLNESCRPSVRSKPPVGRGANDVTRVVAFLERLDLEPREKDGIVPAICPCCGEGRGYFNFNGALRCHSNKCVASKEMGWHGVDVWSMHMAPSLNLSTPTVLAAARQYLSQEPLSAAVAEAFEKTDLPFAVVEELRATPPDGWVPLTMDRDDEESMREADRLYALGGDSSESHSAPLLSRYEYKRWREWLHHLESADALHLEFADEWVWFDNGSVRWAASARALGLATVKNAMRGTSIYTTQTSDVLELMALGWISCDLDSAQLMVMEVAVRVANKIASAYGRADDRLDRIRLALRYGDAVGPLTLAQKLEKDVLKRGLHNVLRLEINLIPALYSLHAHVPSPDRARLLGSVLTLKSKVESQTRLMKRFFGPDANFNDRAVIHGRFVQEGAKLTDANKGTIRRYLSNHDDSVCAMMRLYLEWRELRDELDDLECMIRSPDPLSPEIDALGTCTGRFTYRSPNLLGIHRARRSYFVAKKDRRFIQLDLSQAQLRILAELSSDEHMLEAFERGEDIHRWVACHVFGVPLDEVDDRQRKCAKAVSFGVALGIGKASLVDYAESYGVEMSEDEAGALLDRFFQAFPKIRAFRRTLFEDAQQKGAVKSRSGRTCHIRRGTSVHEDIHEGTTLAYLLQMTEADIIKTALGDLERQLRDKPASIALVVHDAIILDASEAFVEEAAAILFDGMRLAMEKFLERCPHGLGDPEVSDSWAG